MYKSHVLLYKLQDEKFTFITNEEEIEFYLNYVTFPEEWKGDITGIVIDIEDGELSSMFLTESGAPYALSTMYHPLPYYIPENWNPDSFTPDYWSMNNPAYGG